jgi:hypothetical protein
MSTGVLIAIVVGGVLLLLAIGGFIAARRRADSPDWERHVAQADAELEQARASDKGWDKAHLEQAAREALGQQRPDWGYENVHLVLVDDRPGMERDTAHLVAVGADGEAKVVLGRDSAGAWHVDSVS